MKKLTALALCPLLGPFVGVWLDAWAHASHAQTNNYAATYSMALPGGTIVAAATDIACFEGVAGKTHSILRIDVHGHAPVTAAYGSVQLLKRSTLNTGGTSATGTVVPNSSSNAAGTLVGRSYTANAAALGTLVGTVNEVDAYFPVASSATANQITPVFDFTAGQPLILNGATEAVCLSLPAGSALIGNLPEIRIRWQE